MKRKDNSPRVPQRDKLKTPLAIRTYTWTPKQQEFINLALDKNSKIIFVTGPAGSAKTFLSTYVALELMNTQRVSDILYIRSAVESADSKIGFLPGEVEDKMAYYGIPFIDKLKELLTTTDIQKLTKDNRIQIMPINYVRGQNWNARVIIMDEAQNMTVKEIYTGLTRIGRFTKCFVLADPTQSDINGKSGGFVRLRDHFVSPEHGVVEFTLKPEDIMREELVRYLVERYASLNNIQTK